MFSFYQIVEGVLPKMIGPERDPKLIFLINSYKYDSHVYHPSQIMGFDGDRWGEPVHR